MLPGVPTVRASTRSRAPHVQLLLALMQEEDVVVGDVVLAEMGQCPSGVPWQEQKGMMGTKGHTDTWPSTTTINTGRMWQQLPLRLVSPLT